MSVEMLVRVTGLHERMPAAEVLASSELVYREGRFLVVRGDPHRMQSLGYAKSVCLSLGRGTLSELPFDPVGVISGSYAVRTFGPSGLAATMQRLVWQQLESPKVSLREPDVVLHANVTASGVWWGQLVRAWAPDDFSGRLVQVRPFSRSVGIQPRKARCLVNLTGLSAGQSFLDPCCGTGSLVLEAGLLGAYAFGSDVDPSMVRGADSNTSHYGVRAAIARIDARSLERWGRSFDAVATDLPYGMSASLRGSLIEDLYPQILRSIRMVLSPGGTAVVVAPLGTVSAAGFGVLERFTEYVHGSLTREVQVLKRDRTGA